MLAQLLRNLWYPVTQAFADANRSFLMQSASTPTCLVLVSDADVLQIGDPGTLQPYLPHVCQAGSFVMVTHMERLLFLSAEPNWGPFAFWCPTGETQWNTWAPRPCLTWTYCIHDVAVNPLHSRTSTGWQVWLETRTLTWFEQHLGRVCVGKLIELYQHPYRKPNRLPCLLYNNQGSTVFEFQTLQGNHGSWWSQLSKGFEQSDFRVSCVDHYWW